jgi:glycosyltransferase involved in cell wall biosynthesis
MMGTSASDIRFVFYLPNLSSYLDRVQLIGRIADKVGRGVLVTSRLDVPLQNLDLGRLEVIETPKGRRYPGRSAVAASNTVARLLESDNFNVVHDTFAHLSPLFLRRRRHPGQVFLTSFFSLAEWDLREWIRPTYGMRSVTHPNLRQYIQRAVMQRVVSRLADCVVVQAPGLVQRVVRYNKGATSKLTWIPNNVEVPHEPVLREDVDAQSIHLLWAAGGFDRAKGADELLTLLRRSKEREVQIRVSAVGASSPLDPSIPPYLDYYHLRSRMESEGLTESISFLNRIEPDQMDRYYRNADWLFHVSQLDGSPRVALEALGRGLPIIGLKHPGMTVLDPDEQYIFYSDPFDADSVLDQLIDEKADAQSHARRASAGRNYIAENFSSDVISDKYVDLYARLISERVS